MWQGKFAGPIAGGAAAARVVIAWRHGHLRTVRVVVALAAERENERAFFRAVDGERKPAILGQHPLAGEQCCGIDLRILGAGWEHRLHQREDGAEEWEDRFQGGELAGGSGRMEIKTSAEV